METQVFSYEELHRLYNQGQLKDHIEAKNYISKYFFATQEANFFFWDAEEKRFIVRDKEKFNFVCGKRFPKGMLKWFLEENFKVYKIISSITAPIIDEAKKELNFAGRFKHEYKPFKDFDETTRASVDLFLSYMKECLCSFKTELYDYLLLWTASMIQGKKNSSFLYLKSATEGLGKSTFSSFLANHVIGKDLSITSSASPLTTQFNLPLLGQLLVIFEELSLSDRVWDEACAKLKTMITEEGPTTTYEGKGTNSFKATNISNFIIPTNVSAIKHSDGRRIFQLDLNTSRVVISRLLKALENEGKIKLHRAYIEIVK
jgi:hypothetical protein